MEIADIRKAQRDKAEAQKKKLLAEDQEAVKKLAALEAIHPETYKAPAIIYCASCKYWERDSDKAVFAACGLSRRHGLAIGVVRTDTDRCSLAEAR